MWRLPTLLLHPSGILLLSSRSFCHRCGGDKSQRVLRLIHRQPNFVVGLKAGRRSVQPHRWYAVTNQAHRVCPSASHAPATTIFHLHKLDVIARNPFRVSQPNFAAPNREPRRQFLLCVVRPADINIIGPRRPGAVRGKSRVVWAAVPFTRISFGMLS